MSLEDVKKSEHVLVCALAKSFSRVKLIYSEVIYQDYLGQVKNWNFAF